MDFFFCQSLCFSFSGRNMFLITLFSNPTLYFFFLILVTKCVSSCFVKIYFYSQHIFRFFFISRNILIPHTFPTSSSPLHIFFFACNVFILVPDVFNFSYRIQLHEPSFFFSLAICQLETEPNTCYLVCPRPCIFKTH